MSDYLALGAQQTKKLFHFGAEGQIRVREEGNDDDAYDNVMKSRVATQLVALAIDCNYAIKIIDCTKNSNCNCQLRISAIIRIIAISI